MNLRLTVLVAGLLSGSIAFAAPTSISFSSLGGSTIDFSGGSNFSITGGAFDQFDITNCYTNGSVTPCTDTHTVGLDGDISGTYTIGTPVGITAPVTGSGIIEIKDENGVDFTGNLTWVEIEQFGSGGQLNDQAVVNVTGVSYTGTNTDLKAMAVNLAGDATLSWSFSTTETLAQLKAGGVSTGYSGAYAPIPEPSFYGLLALGVVGAIWANQRKKKTA
jgi:hypothetical protein